MTEIRTALEITDVPYTVDIGCGTVDVAHADLVNLPVLVAEEQDSKLGYTSVEEYVSLRGEGRKVTVRERAEAAKRLRAIEARLFVYHCLVGCKCVDDAGDPVTIARLRVKLLEPLQARQLQQLQQISYTYLYYLRAREDEAREDLKKSPTGIADCGALSRRSVTKVCAPTSSRICAPPTPK